MSHIWCDECEKFHWDNEKHLPSWFVWPSDEDREDYGDTMRGETPEAAAEKFVRNWDSDTAEYSVASGGEMVICVQAVSPYAKTRKFTVSGEAVPQYRSIEKFE